MEIKEQLTKYFQQQKWDAEQTEKMQILFSVIGENTATFVAEKIRKPVDSRYADRIIQAAIWGSEWPNMIATDQQKIVEELSFAWFSDQYNFGEYALPAVMDIMGSNIRNRITGPLKQLFLQFELYNIDSISREELQRMLQYDSITIAGFSDLVLDVNRYAFYHTFITGDKNWGSDLLKALTQNEEIMGTNNLVIEDRTLKPVIASWIQDYLWVVKNSGEQGAFNLAKYLQNSKNVSQLNSEQKNQLAAVIKTYLWLRTPQINETSVLQYERSLELRYNDGWKQFWDNYEARGQSNTSNQVQQQPREVDTIKRVVKQSEPVEVPKVRQEINLQNILNKGSAASNSGSGIKYDGASNVKVEEISQRLEAERSRKQVVIDKKLQDLKQRKTVN